MIDKCELYDRECINCGECTICDLDPEKRCDDCCRCIENSQDYRTINVQKFIEEHEEYIKYSKKKKNYKRKKVD